VEQLKHMNDQYPLGVIGGVSDAERAALLNCETFNGARVQLAQSWVVRCLVKRRKAGGLAVDAPVLGTGCYRTMQTTNDAFQQCKKIVDTPFPLPYAQAVLLMLVIWMIFVPFLICEIVNDTALACVFSFLPTFAFAILNEVARDLEDPFGHAVRARLFPCRLVSDHVAV
jgi:predicted membrane chloride channel (bestrophin family)